MHQDPRIGLASHYLPHGASLPATLTVHRIVQDNQLTLLLQGENTIQFFSFVFNIQRVTCRKLRFLMALLVSLNFEQTQ